MPLAIVLNYGMANEHVALLKQGVDAWNAWREQNPNIRPDLSKADLSRADLTQERDRDWHHHSVVWPYLLDLRGADLSGAKLEWAGLSYADLSGADLTGASLASAACGATCPSTG